MNLGPRSYDIQIGSGAVRALPRWLSSSPSKRAVAIVDAGLPQAVKTVTAPLSRAGWKIDTLRVEAGERLKEIDRVYALYGELLKLGVDRRTLVLAVGGGTVGDAVGFVAGTFMRGIPWVGVPTTLLGQVDSSVGGKTGINHREGKNLIGVFHQPSLVVCDTDFLKTLSKRERISGLGEILKYGIAFDPRFFQFMRSRLERFLRLDPSVVLEAIERSLQWKCKLVAKDELDRSGVREALNFGHTFGHALESATDYQRYQHGEAVLWGMRFALAVSQVSGNLEPEAAGAVDTALSELDIPPLPARLSFDGLVKRMLSDKKNHDGEIKFVLASRIGRVFSKNVSVKDLAQAWKVLQTRMRADAR
jgi:3-dehydroquinate synthase